MVMPYEQRPWRDRLERALEELREASIVCRQEARTMISGGPHHHDDRLMLQERGSFDPATNASS
jgi:hypothetical protein